jgi:hypothetical protein
VFEFETRTLSWLIRFQTFCFLIASIDPQF